MLRKRLLLSLGAIGLMILGQEIKAESFPSSLLLQKSSGNSLSYSRRMQGRAGSDTNHQSSEAIGESYSFKEGVLQILRFKYAKNEPYPLLAFFNSSQLHQLLVLTNAGSHQRQQQITETEEKYYCNQLFLFRFEEGELFAHETLEKLPWPLEDQLKEQLAEPAVVASVEEAAPAIEAVKEVEQEKEPRYPIKSFFFKYAQPHPEHPNLNKVYNLEVGLVITPEGYAAPRPGDKTVKVKLSDLSKNPNGHWFLASAIVAVAKQVVQVLNEEGLIGVYVAVNPAQINAYGQDLRPKNQQLLTLEISTAALKNVRTVCVGERFKDKNVNHPAYKRIQDNSPVHTTDGRKTLAGTLLKKKEINDYVYRLNRYPFRRVDVQLNAADEAGYVDLDYLVHEDKPWQVYANTSNTGPRHTSPWFERIGVVDYQLTNNDDTLSLEYATTGFKKIHTALGTYESPAGNLQNLRWRVYGLYNHFNASEFALLSALFTGQQWIAGTDLIVNAAQHNDLFLDLIFGARWTYIDVHNHLADVYGHSNFFLPRFGIGLERRRVDSTIYAIVYVEGNVSDISDTKVSELIKLGRITNDKNWQLLNWTIFLSTFLEPWSPNGCPKDGHLANEIAWTLNGQYAFDYRLIPQMQRIAGGLHSVRGYPQSIAAGDSVYISQAEYRYHLPRGLKIQPHPKHKLFGKPFRVRPQHPCGRPDWDFIIKSFFDVGRTVLNDRTDFEKNFTLIGTGLGLEFVVKRNIVVSGDWGIALNKFSSVSETVDAGNSHFYFSATLLY